MTILRRIRRTLRRLNSRFVGAAPAPPEGGTAERFWREQANMREQFPPEEFKQQHFDE